MKKQPGSFDVVVADLSNSQHFQGLRRAQNKADSNGVASDHAASRRVDPTLNPITRRPGPGRGRPRKQPGAAATAAPAGAAAPPVAHPNNVAGVPGAPVGAPPQAIPGAQPVPGAPIPMVPSAPIPMMPGVPVPGAASGVPGVAGVPVGHPGVPVGPGAPIGVGPGVGVADMGMPTVGAPQGGGGPTALAEGSDSGQGETPADDELAVDPSLEDADDDQEHAAKRPRLDDNQGSSLDDEAVMNALAAHTNPETGDPYEQE